MGRRFSCSPLQVLPEFDQTVTLLEVAGVVNARYHGVGIPQLKELVVRLFPA